MAFQEKILSQLHPSDITATTAFTVSDGYTNIITTIHVCNTSLNDLMFSIYLDDDGTTYDKTTALYYDVPISAKETVQIQTHVGMNTVGGSIGVKGSAGASLTFTINGVEID